MCDIFDCEIAAAAFGENRAGGGLSVGGGLQQRFLSDRWDNNPPGGGPAFPLPPGLPRAGRGAQELGVRNAVAPGVFLGVFHCLGHDFHPDQPAKLPGHGEADGPGAAKPTKRSALRRGFSQGAFSCNRQSAPLISHSAFSLPKIITKGVFLC